MSKSAFNSLMLEVRACRLCDEHLPHSPRPVLQAAPSAQILIIGQAPGAKVQESGVPWQDKSGDTLRDWMGIDESTFYDASKVALVPMGFCYPGRGTSGDLPPRKECAEAWHERLLSYLKRVELTLLVGAYAQKAMLGAARKTSLTETVRAFAEYLPEHLPLPHPSPRNNIWQARHPWFREDVLPALERRVSEVLG